MVPKWEWFFYWIPKGWLHRLRLRLRASLRALIPYTARVRHARATDAGISGIDLDGTPHSHAHRNRICENTDSKYLVHNREDRRQTAKRQSAKHEASGICNV